MKKSDSLAANKQFALSGPAGKVDRRITPARGDLADISLAGRIFAPHYVEPVVHHCTVPYSAIHAQPSADSTILSELLLGEQFALLDISGHWAWGQCADACCGFVRHADLATGEGIATEGADSTSEAPLDATAFAEAAVGAPYAPGGQGGAGYDAGGLVRRALAAQGITISPFPDLQLSSRALKTAEAPEKNIIAYAGDYAAICLSPEEVVAALPDKGVVRITLDDFVAFTDVAEAIYRKRS